MNFIDGKTKLVGLFGYPIEHSFSPLMHNSAFQALNLNYAYLPFAVKPTRIAAAVDAVRALDLVGVNVTIPHKENVIPYLDEIDSAARLIGAVNTIVNKDGKLLGYNTDGPGFVHSLESESKIKIKGKKMMIMGAGGAARAVAIQSALVGANEIVIVNRDKEKALAIVQTIRENCSPCLAKAYTFTEKIWQEKLVEIDIFIDTSPVGMYPHLDVEPIVSAQFLRPGLLVGDLVYNPRETVLLRSAKEKGAGTWGGLGMLIEQGALAFELWTGKKPPLNVMTSCIDNFLAKK